MIRHKGPFQREFGFCSEAVATIQSFIILGPSFLLSPPRSINSKILPKVNIIGNGN